MLFCTPSQIINLDLLDTIGASRGTEELKEELKKQVGGVCIVAFTLVHF